MKKIFILILFAASMSSGYTQEVYCDFEANKKIFFGPRTGVLDSTYKNPQREGINYSGNCLKYRRGKSKQYDVMKILPLGALRNVETYASHHAGAPKFKIKLYTSAPVGTKIEIQLGKRGSDNYPAGVHSQYQVITTVQNKWEELEFKFSQIPEGSNVNANEVDQVTLLFAPDSKSHDVYYIDDITGPAIDSSVHVSKRKN